MPLFELQHHRQVSQDGKVISRPSPESLQRKGATLQVIISPTKKHIENLLTQGKQPPAPIIGNAIIDTGATITSVDESICKKLGLTPTGQMVTAHAGGSEVRACYPIQITFPDIQFPSITSPKTMSVNLQSCPYVLLFGCDLLTRMKFIYNGPQGRFEIAF